MKKKINKATDKIIGKIAIPTIVIAGLLVILAVIFDAKGTSEQNNAYIRVINCIVSYNASSRTQENIERCYMTVEADLNTKLQRYDNAH